MLRPTTPILRRPSLWTILACFAAAAGVVAMDAFFSATEGYLSRPPYYDGAGYMFFARSDRRAVALILGAVALLAEYSDAPTRTSYLASAVFAAAAVLIKPSTSPLLLLVWFGALAVVWFVNRRRAGTTRHAALAVALLA